MKFNFKHKINYIHIFTIFFLLLIYLFLTKTSFAALCEGIPSMRMYLCSSNGSTNWGVNVKYYDIYGNLQYSNSNVYTSLSGSPSACPASTDRYGYFNIDNYVSHDGDKITWHTACVDPTVLVDVSRSIQDRCVAWGGADVTCKTGYSQNNCIYGGCGSPNNRGTVSSGSKCPDSINLSDHCIYAGQIATCPVTHCADYCSGCTLINKYCSSSSTSCLTGSSVAYSSSCGTQSTCSPPAPTVNAVASCVNNAGSISTTWGNVQYSNGVYDFRYKRSVDSTWIYDYDAPEPKVLNNLASNTTYNIQVRGYTTSGHHGPTAWGSDNVTTGDCKPPCDSGITCGACSISSPSCGTGTQTCTYTTLSTGEACTPSSFSQSCTVGCSAGESCISNTCVCNTPATPTGLAPSGNITAGTRNITWNAVSGITKYALRVDDLTNGWTGTCSSVNPGDVCNNNVTGTSYSYNFIAGHSYHIWVHAIAACGVYSAAAETYTNIYTNVLGQVFIDYNGNGAIDLPTDTGYAGVKVTLSNGQTATTVAGGAYTIANVLPGTYTESIVIPSGYTLTYPNPYPPTVYAYSPNITQNFGIKPPAPTCSGGLTASPTSVNPGGTSTLTAVGCTTSTGATPDYTYYDDSTIAGDSVTNNNTNTSTFTAPSPYWTQTVANPSVAVCNPGGGACSNYGAAITIIPVFSVSGNVFVDQNKDQLQNGADTNYTGGISISPNPTGATVTYNAGDYLISGLTGGTYTISYTSLPVGYQLTYPLNGPPPSFSVTVGSGCSAGGSNSASCDANGNITLLRYGITNSIPWIQTTGGDPYLGSGISNPIPDNNPSCGPYMSLRGAGGTPGIVFTGNGSVNLGFGQASQNPDNWLVGQPPYTQTYTPKGTELKTSYNTMHQTALRSGITPTALGNSECGAGGIASCVLAANLANGVYIANGNLTLTGASYTFPAGKDFVILVNGDLNIQTEVHVPIGSSALFTASGNINVASSVGEAVTSSTRANVEGYNSADKSFYVQGIISCTTADRRLNVAGSIAVNAALTGGSFVNQRDLCAGNLQCPASTVTERPDFVLNAPDFLKSARRIWQEIAP